MSDVTAERFTCDACGKTYAWKPELAGRRVKCKCGSTISVPRESAPQEPDDMYDLAPSDEPVKPKRPPTQAIPGAPTASTARSAALAYQAPPTRRDPMSTAALLDMKRDVYVPAALLAAGVIAYLACYAFRYHLTGYGIAVTSIGLLIMTVFKAVLMVGFALFLANPLGVSFGGIWTATLKLGAIAVFSDGITTWVDLAVARMSGGAFGSGIFGYGMMSFPIAMGIYWVLLIYLFSMDSGDSWMVVILLSFFDQIVKMALVFLVLSTVLHMGGVSAPGLPSLASNKKINSEMSTRIEEMQQAQVLKEAHAYIASGHQAVFLEPTDGWYQAGAKNVWFEVSRDFNGKTTPQGVIVELPEAKSARAKCLQIRQDFYAKEKMLGGATTDDGEPYMEVRLR